MNIDNTKNNTRLKNIIVFACDHRKDIKWDLPFIRIGTVNSDAVLKVPKDDECAKLDTIAGEVMQILYVYKHLEEFGNPEYIGFCHYRRFLTLSKSNTNNYPILNTNIIEKELILDSSQQLTIMLLKNVDGILPAPYVDQSYCENCLTQRDMMWNQNIFFKNEKNNYNTQLIHSREEVDMCFDTLIENTPDEYKESMKKVINMQISFHYNMFTLTNELFRLYGKIIYPTCMQLIEKINAKDLDKRWLGYLLERLTSCVLMMFIDNNKKFIQANAYFYGKERVQINLESKIKKNKSKSLKVALVCIAKDEDNYIEEWIDYHKKLGFDDIFVYQNNWTSKFSKTNIAKFIQFDGFGQQVNAYNDFIKKYYFDYDFAAFFDVDEFLVLKQHKNIKDFLQNYTDFQGISISWRIFGDSNLSKLSDQEREKLGNSVLKRFTMCENKYDPNAKIIINLALTKGQVKFYYNPHIITGELVDPNKKFLLKSIGRNEHINDNSNVEIAELNHYRNKTFQEFYIRHFKKTTPEADDQLKIHPAFYNEKLFKEDFNFYNRNNEINTLARDFMYGL